MIDRRELLRLSAASMLSFPAGLLGRAAAAQTQTPIWPGRFVRMIVPYPAGGGADTIARLVAGRLSDTWGQQVLMENRGGAGGNIASEAAARSAPDGHTMYLAGEFQATNLYLYSKLAYDPVADFVPVTLVVQYPAVLVVPNSSPAHSVKEFIAHGKANPGKVTFASPGYGTGPHLAGELFKRVAGIELTHAVSGRRTCVARPGARARRFLLQQYRAHHTADAAGPTLCACRDVRQANPCGTGLANTG